MTDWPAGADGGVFRRLAAAGFDFEKPCEIDLNIDFAAWPPPAEALAVLRIVHPDVVVHAPEDGFGGYFEVKVFGPLTYDLVVRTQQELSKLMMPFGGRCESWGVLHQGAEHK